MEYWTFLLLLLCVSSFSPVTVWLPQPGVLLLGAHHSAVASASHSIDLFLITQHHSLSPEAYFFLTILSEVRMTTLSSVAPRSVGPFLSSFHHRVQCRVTSAFSDTLCLLIGGFRPFMFEVITACPQYTYSSFWCLFLLCLLVVSSPLLPFQLCVFLMLYDLLGSIRIDVCASSTGVFPTQNNLQYSKRPEGKKMNFSWQQNSALTLSPPLLGMPKATVVIFSEGPSLSLGFSCVCSSLGSATSPLDSDLLIKVFWPILGTQTKCLHLRFYEWLRVL